MSNYYYRFLHYSLTHTHLLAYYGFALLRTCDELPLAWPVLEAATGATQDYLQEWQQMAARHLCTGLTRCLLQVVWAVHSLAPTIGLGARSCNYYCFRLATMCTRPPWAQFWRYIDYYCASSTWYSQMALVLTKRPQRLHSYCNVLLPAYH